MVNILLTRVKKSHIMFLNGGVVMLIRFNVKNFLSFNKMQEFSMISGKVRSKMEHIYADDKIKLLKFAAIYGANASGKSNLVLALDFMKETIINGLPEVHATKYCKINSSNKNQTSYFELEIKIKDRYYAYGFEVLLNNSSITSEWLIEILPDNKEKEIFVRNILEGTYNVKNYFKDKNNIGKLELYADDIKSDDSILFIRVMNQNKDSLYNDSKNEVSILQEVYNWINNKLDINYPDRPVSDYSYFVTNKNFEEICRIISAFGTGITKFNEVEVKPDKMATEIPKNMLQKITTKLQEANSKNKKAGKNKKSAMIVRSNRNDFFILEIDIDDNISCKTIEFNHGDNNNLFSLSEESDGTIRILDLIEVLLDKNNEKIYVIDELDRCLHPQLTYKFIETFLEIAKIRNVQLVVTTHESRLLDFELLRRDEVWFVNKNIEGESSIYSLEEYNTRFDQKIDKAYLEGRYGGVPLFNTVFPIKED
jgi:AAA15 family ATPase/GTPase